MLSDKFNRVIADRYTEWLKESEKFIADETKRVGISKKELATPQLEGSFRKLELD